LLFYLHFLYDHLLKNISI